MWKVCRVSPSFLAAMALTAFLVGCGNKNLGQVSGTVTLDGTPLSEATVVFTPITGGRPAAAITDASGNYELIYDRESSGAMLGEHLVEITTAYETEDAEGNMTVVKEKIPAKYNFNSELRADIQEGQNTFDFALESEGEVLSESELEAQDEG